jgi:hypothetical protein
MPTLTALEHAVLERQVLAQGPARGAGLGGRVPAVREQDLPAAPGLLVRDLPGELTPRRIADGAGEFTVWTSCR